MNTITISTTINADSDKIWKFWNEPAHIEKWAFASNDWECPHAENNLQVGSSFKTVMSAKDKSSSFDFIGTYTNIIPNRVIEYTMEDGRKVSILFEPVEEGTIIIETFDPESQNTLELQREGWQSILNNFKKYVEEN